MHPLIREIQSTDKKIPADLRVGSTVRIQQKVVEGEKTRLQAFEGLVIAISHGEGIEKTFTLRKIVEGVGVEKTFPFHAATLASIQVKKTARVRRSKLYFMRKRSGKSARLQEKFMIDVAPAAEAPAPQEAVVEEAIQAQAKKEK